MTFDIMIFKLLDFFCKLDSVTINNSNKIEKYKEVGRKHVECYSTYVEHLFRQFFTCIILYT